MKIPIMFRQIQNVPVENREKQKELEHRSDLAALRLGIPLPNRLVPFTGKEPSTLRVHEREYDSIAEFARLHDVWLADQECQQIAAEWEHVYTWQKQEILYIDDPFHRPIIPWMQMAGIRDEDYRPRFAQNPNYVMPKDQQDPMKWLEERKARK